MTRPLGRRTSKGENFKDTGSEDVDWIHLAQDRDQWGGGSCEHGKEASSSVECGGYWNTK